MRSVTVPLFLVVLFGVLSAGTIALGASAFTVTEGDVVRAIREQVELLKWVGGAMVTGLTIAIGWLWKALREDRKESFKVTEKLGNTIEALHVELKQRPCLLKDK